MNPTLKRLLLSPICIVKNDLVGWYIFGEGSGQILTDYSFYGFHGTLGSTAGADTNDPTWVTQGLSFGSDDYVTVGNTGKAIKTIQLVFYNLYNLDKAAGGGGALQLGGSQGIWFSSYAGALTDEIISFEGTTGKCGWCGNDVVLPGNHILDVVYTDSNYDIILDGQKKPVTKYNTPNVITASDVKIGKVGSVYFNNKSVFMLLMYDRSLTDVELARNRKAIKAELAKRGVMLP